MTDLLSFRDKAPRRSPEETLQKAIVQHLRLTGNPKAIWMHVPNGEHRSKRTGARLKAMGVQAGVADLIFALPDGRFAAMELKAPGGLLSPAQRAFQDKCVALGVDHCVVADIDTALNFLRGWGMIR